MAVGRIATAATDWMDVLFGGTLLDTIVLDAAAAYAVVEIPFSVLAVSNSGPLILDHAGGDNVGILLDRVELHSVDDGGGDGQAPAPATLALLGLGLAGIGLQRRRRSTA